MKQPLMESAIHPPARASRARKYFALFATSYLLFFLFSSRGVNPHDEGIATLSAMRVLAGQVPYRDFYYNYGPALIYTLATLFKLFGPSLLACHLLDLFFSAVLMVTLCYFARTCCTRRTALGAAMLALVWFVCGANWQPLVVLLLWSTWLTVPAFQRDQPRHRTFLAGLLVGCATLYRPDCGIALIAVHASSVALALVLRSRTLLEALRSAARMSWPYLLAIVVLLAPPACLYLSVAPASDFLYDLLYYNARYYRPGRGLPFPGIHLISLQDLVIYVLIVVMAVSTYALARYVLTLRQTPRTSAAGWVVPDWVGLLVPFTLLAAVMYVKGLVRLSAGQLFPSCVPCILILAVLVDRRSNFKPAIQRVLAATTLVFFLAGIWTILFQVHSQHKHRTSVLAHILLPSSQAPRPPFDRWCSEATPITDGFCYVLDDDHIQAVEYLRSHTQPGDTLYVGQPHHDRIFAGDNITYFATGLMPATKWTQFDPFLQNRADIQQQMIADLDRNAPPYIAEDSEFEKIHEPNGSSQSTGVFLLDDYIAAHYHLVQTYGEMTIFQRDSAK